MSDLICWQQLKATSVHLAIEKPIELRLFARNAYQSEEVPGSSRQTTVAHSATSAASHERPGSGKLAGRKFL